MKKITLFFLALASFGFSQAQGLSGDYYIPQGANPQGFASLYDAAVALSTDGLVDNTNFIIADNLTETKSTALVNTSDFTLTIKPDAAVTRTITFDLPQRNANNDVTEVKGAIAIGVKPSMVFADIVPSKNIVIDGSFDGGAERYLRITTTTSTLISHNPVMIYNGTNNVTLKNCHITHLSKVNSNGAADNNQDGYVLIKAFTNIATPSNMPNNLLIENNEITAHDVSEQTCIRFDASTTGGDRATNPATQSTEVVIRNNKLLGRTFGVALAHINGALVEGNEVRMHKVYSATFGQGIGAGYWWNKNSDAANISGTITVRNNKITELAIGQSNTGSPFMTGIGNAAQGTWEIYNNFVTGFNCTTSHATNPIRLTGISARAAGTKVYNNTIVMNELPGSYSATINERYK